MERLAFLAPEVSLVCTGLIDGLISILGRKLYGVYLYGAAVFSDGGPAQDIDCHVVLAETLTNDERAAVVSLHHRLAAEFPPLGGELDAYYILLEAARRPDNPQHQLDPNIFDNAWPLHCAHVRAGNVVTLYGPEPVAIFPAPTWPSLAEALDHELDFVRRNLQYPAYCILNLCRILYSFQARDVAVSKQFCARWALQVYPAWELLVAAALRSYERIAAAQDQVLMAAKLSVFLVFMELEIAKARTESR